MEIDWNMFLGRDFQKDGEKRMEELKKDIETILSKVELEPNIKKRIVEEILYKFNGINNLIQLEEKLKILYEYEKKYLELIKEYKEEIKFATALEEELRKEKTKFFAEDLKEVTQTLKDAQVDSKVASMWIKELVESYTRSLELSKNLIEEHTLDMIGEIRKEAKKEVQYLNSKKD